MTNNQEEMIKDMLYEEINNIFVDYSKKQHEKKQRGGIHTSSLIMPSGSFCVREQVINYFKNHDDYNPLPPHVVRRMENGTFIHRKWQTIFNETGKALRTEQQHFNDCYITGTPDIIAKLGNKKYVIELKSIKADRYETMTKLPVGTKRQLQYYEYLTGIPNGLAIYENTNTSDYRIYISNYDEEFVREYVERQYEIKKWVKKYLKDRKLPEKHERCTHKTAGRANTCGCTELCFNTNRLEEIVSENFGN